jgi:hypothetical protein
MNAICFPARYTNLWILIVSFDIKSSVIRVVELLTGSIDVVFGYIVLPLLSKQPTPILIAKLETTIRIDYQVFAKTRTSFF